MFVKFRLEEQPAKKKLLELLKGPVAYTKHKYYICCVHTQWRSALICFIFFLIGLCIFFGFLNCLGRLIQTLQFIWVVVQPKASTFFGSTNPNTLTIQITHVVWRCLLNNCSMLLQTTQTINTNPPQGLGQLTLNSMDFQPPSPKKNISILVPTL